MLTSGKSNRTLLQKYLEENIFLADINNEKAEKNATYKMNLLRLTNFVLIMYGSLFHLL